MLKESPLWQRISEPWLGLCFPEVCQICSAQRAAAAEGFVCVDCWQQVRFVRAPFCDRCGLPFEGEITNAFACSNCRDVELHFSRARSAVVARGLVLEVIHRFKYQQALWFEPFLADLLRREAGPALAGGEWNLIVPVPLHPLKRREREFNQAERLARRLGRDLGLPMDTRALQRITPTRTQTQLNREERMENVRRAFVCTETEVVRGRHVVVVDDVLTTGATTNACARALRQAGAAEVCVWTVARGLIHSVPLSQT